MGDTCVWAECGGVELAAKVGVDGSLHPHVDGEGFEVSEAEKGSARGNFIAYSFDCFECFKGLFVSVFALDFYYVNFTVCNFFGGVKYVSVAESRL